MQQWIFDFDGTLVDTDGLFYTCLTHALEPFNVPMPMNFMEEIRHKHPHRIFEDFLSEEQADEAMKRMRLIGEEISEGIKPFQGIEEILRGLEKNKVGISVWTGRDKSSTIRILKTTGLHDYFDQVISGTCVPTNKPEPDGLLFLKEFYKANEDEMVMIGDHHHDIEPANHLGMVSVHAKWKKEPHELPIHIQSQFSFDCTKKFFEWSMNHTQKK